VTRAWLLRRLVGDVRRHGAVWLALAAAFAVVGFVTAGARLAERAAAAAPAEPEALVIAYLADELDAPGVAELRRVLSTLPGVVEVRAVSAREGLERLRGGLGARAAVLEGVGTDLLSSSLEIVARPTGAAAALAFRLRRLRGISDVDLVSEAPPAASARRVPLAMSVRAPVVLGGALGLLALVAALRLLGARLRLELGLLFSLGLSRAASARPARWLATTSGLLGAGLGSGAAVLGARAWGGGALPARELALVVAALVVAAFIAPRLALRVPEAAGAR
jgi:FtsX-like permease family protein